MLDGRAHVGGERSARAQRVELVEEDDARRRVARALEHLPHGALALAHVLHSEY